MEYTLEKVNIKDKVTGETKGRKWSLTPVGLLISGKWYNSAVFEEKQLEGLKVGLKADLILYEEEYKGKMYDKFKFPTESDEIKSRIERLEKALATLYNNPKIKELLNL
jgi:hypothetical protein